MTEIVTYTQYRKDTFLDIKRDMNEKLQMHLSERHLSAYEAPGVSNNSKRTHLCLNEWMNEWMNV